MATHNEVAHNWAHRTGRKAKGFNMYYEGDTIFSYGRHFPIARHIELETGHFILFTKDRHSVSTAKHITYTRRAIGYGNPALIEVPDVSAFNVMSSDGPDYRKMAAEQAYEALEKGLEEIALKWKKARTYKNLHAADMAREIENMNRLAEAFQLDRIATMPEDIGAFVAEADAREKAARKAQDAKDKAAIRKWLVGETVTAPHTRTPYVRVVGEMVQTSWGVNVPLAEAFPLFQKANECRAAGMRWSGFPPMTVGGYSVKGIDAQGTLTVGCHVIPLRAQREAARLAGIA